MLICRMIEVIVVVVVINDVISVSIDGLVVYNCVIDFNDCDLFSGGVITVNAIIISFDVILIVVVVCIFINADFDVSAIIFYIFD